MEETQKSNTPAESVFTLTIPLDRSGKKKATYHIKEIDEDVYLAARTYFDKDKDFDAVKLMIKALLVQPSDDPALLNGNFVACRSAVKMFLEILKPVDGELKKN
jgi:hypothetical protein